jgi:hypothetical protein
MTIWPRRLRSADVDASAFDIRRMLVSQALRIVITEQNAA